MSSRVGCADAPEATTPAASMARERRFNMTPTQSSGINAKTLAHERNGERTVRLSGRVHDRGGPGWLLARRLRVERNRPPRALARRNGAVDPLRRVALRGACPRAGRRG